MTKATTSSIKSSQKDQASHQSTNSVGRDGVAQAPPTYGIDFVDNAPIQRVAAMPAPPTSPQPIKQNRTGLPTALKTGVESLSGFSMDDVRVHYNSPKPAQLQAYAYAQGNDIHLGSGQEKHLPHEAWHVVQQKQGKVKPTLQMKGLPINTDAGLEKEADVMGQKATHTTHGSGPVTKNISANNQPVIQGKIFFGMTILNEQRLREHLYTRLVPYVDTRDLFDVAFHLSHTLFHDMDYDMEDHDIGIGDIVGAVETLYREEGGRPLRQSHYTDMLDFIKAYTYGGIPYFIEETFIARLIELIERSEDERGENVRLITIDHLLDEAPNFIKRAFADFVAGRENGLVSQIMSQKLKLIFGFHRVQNLLTALGLAEGQQLEFRTQGIKNIEFMTALPNRNNVYNNMRSKYNTPADADQYLPEVIASGNDFPVERQVQVGDKFYKLMGSGANFMWPPSPYFLTKERLERAVATTNLIEGNMGLPLTSYSPVYFVYEIVSRTNNQVFESTIAPTVQRVYENTANRNTNQTLRGRHQRFTNIGGVKQTLILDNNNTQKWYKNPNPVKIYDPVEPTPQRNQ